VGKSDIVRALWLMSSAKKDGSERLNFTAFYEHSATAKGVYLGLGSKVGKGDASSAFHHQNSVQ